MLGRATQRLRELDPSHVSYVDLYPNPNKDTLRWQVFAAFAYSAKGISYHTFWCRQEKGYQNALVNKDGSLDRKYGYAKAINARLLAQGAR